MSKWTRRDLVKAGLAASASAMSGGAALAQPVASAAITAMAREAIRPVELKNGLRERLLMDFGWRFALGNACNPDKDFGYGKLRREGTFAKAGRVDGPAAVKFDDSKWRSIDLPHDWAVELPFVNDPILVEHGAKPLGREYPETSVGWYRREFQISPGDLGKRIRIEFDGMFRNATVFLNGYYLAQNMSGYAPLVIDVTDFLNYPEPLADGKTTGTGKNVLVVRVDASLDEGWFYEGAGIYRHVWLTKTAPVHVALWGNYIQSTVSGSSASLNVSTEVTNAGNSAVQARVHTVVLDANGRQVATAPSKMVSIEAGSIFTFEAKATVANPALWSIETPNLYQAVTSVEADGKTVDQVETTFGIRTLHYDAAKGFFLNGKHVKIKGMCNHQDHAGVGEAIPDRIQAYRIERLQGMGTNGCRTSHNAPTTEFLDACDRMGMLVMDETRTMSSSEEGLSELERLVKRDRNHPCVVIWSLGNEEPQQASKRGARIVGTMKKLQHKLDPSRVATAAMNGGWGGVGITNVLDVQGFNYNLGKIDAFHKEYPQKPSIGTETASTLATRGIYANDPVRGYMSAYDVNPVPWGKTAEEWWSFYDARDFISGGFCWTGFDYRGETTPYKWPCISSHFGIMDTCGFPKDTYFYYKAWWGKEPVLHLFPHWNWEGKEGQEIEVWTHCNQESVELFLNGKSLGSQQVKKNGHLAWKVKYAPGAIEARASKGGRVVLTEKRETTGAPAKIIATPDRKTIVADGQDVSVVNLAIADAQGRIVPTASNLITFSVSGPGKLIGVGNGDPSCHESDKGSQRSAFNGLCMGIVQSNRGETGNITVTLTADGLQPATVVLEAKAGKLLPVAD
ncbi:MAG TPA: beta-galactosidase GalA [Edaphobacter sp.]|nr:beta-galactosidase GalA [Edaphobacter sp.]